MTPDVERVVIHAPPMNRRRGIRLAVAILGLLALLGVGGCLMSQTRPEGSPSPEADALARRIERAVNAEAWARTGAVRFSFRGNRHWLWDRFGSQARMRSGDREVLIRTTDRTGVAFEDGVKLEGEAAKSALADTWKAFCNDTFWFNPLVKLFDEGTQRALVDLPPDSDAVRGLLVTYTSGGVTPGDAYLWHVGDDDRPVAWQMWVSVLPISGVRMGWDAWETLATGAVVSTHHESTLSDLVLTDVAGAETLAALEPGAFARLTPEDPRPLAPEEIR